MEDKRLYQALGHIDNGRYVDIGAYEPEFHSVTKVFYDDGWSGVNVEPNPRAFALLEEERPRDVNVKGVVWDESFATLWLTDRRGRSSLFQEHNEANIASGLQTQAMRVVGYSLVDICSVIDTDINFLKIDAEGAEEKVIKSGDWSLYRPWIVVAEARLPRKMGSVMTDQTWEPLLLEQGYIKEGYDGLNNWYCAEESLDRLPEGWYNVR